MEHLQAAEPDGSRPKYYLKLHGGDDSDATAEAIATCAVFAPFNSLEG